MLLLLLLLLLRLLLVLLLLLFRQDTSVGASTAIVQGQLRCILAPRVYTLPLVRAIGRTMVQGKNYGPQITVKRISTRSVVGITFHFVTNGRLVTIAKASIALSAASVTLSVCLSVYVCLSTL